VLGEGHGTVSESEATINERQTGSVSAQRFRHFGRDIGNPLQHEFMAVPSKCLSDVSINLIAQIT
jgi:hypothetical protein